MQSENIDLQYITSKEAENSNSWIHGEIKDKYYHRLSSKPEIAYHWIESKQHTRVSALQKQHILL